MDKSGKGLEKIIKLIEDTLKDSPETTVYNNYKIKNSGGRFREFDVFIESKINGHEIKIAIECKDHKNPIAAEKIEAFETKCNRIKSINKKIFISSKGFQAEAKNVAKDCGIELQVASKLNSNEILNWFPITKLDIRLLSGGSAEVYLDLNENEIKEIEKTLTGIFLRTGNEILLNDYIFELYKLQRVEINKFAHSEWLKLTKEKQKEPFLVGVKFNTLDFKYLDNKKLLNVTGINVFLNMQLEYIPVQPLQSISLSDIDGNHKADTITIDLENGATGTFVRTPDNKTNIYLNGPEGSLKHIELIATYNKKLDTNNS